MILRDLNGWREYIKSPLFLEEIELLCPKDEIERQAVRYEHALERFRDVFGDARAGVFSAPGRTELCGNHTDHQHGRTLSASVSMDIIAVAAPVETGVIRLRSKGFGRTDSVDLRLLHPVEEEKNQAASVIRGVAAKLKEMGYRIGGFDAYTLSNVPRGGGLSSSAAFETLVGTILNQMYNNGAISPSEIARAGHYAENVFFGKPCGLLDQMSTAIGGIIGMDFAGTEPVIERLEADLYPKGYDICVVNTGGSHNDLTEDYADIPREMSMTARCLGAEALGLVPEQVFEDEMYLLRGKVSDRAILRAFHFFQENRRVSEQINALKQGKIKKFLNLTIESGRSSFMYLQNAYPTACDNERAIALALAVSEKLLDGIGAWRLHGGGFAGTILAYVPKESYNKYSAVMNKLFGNCVKLSIRPVGGYMLGGGVRI